MELNRALEILEYNKDMLTCDMSISRDPEHQDVCPDYYGKDAENLYYAIVCVEKYIKSAIPVKWIDGYIKRRANDAEIYAEILFISDMVEEWNKENARD